MSSSSVEKIKERLSIVDVISSYISLTQINRNYKAKCPFHNEKTPSFFVSPERGSYYCFGCGAKGDIFSFVEYFEGTDFLGALKLLADKAGVTLENDYSKKSKGEKEKFYQIMEEATLFFGTILSKELAPQAYLKERGISKKMIKSFRIGYAPDSWQSVSTYLIEKGFEKEDLYKVGLIKNNERDSFYDRFRNRIIFPINDSSGRVIAFSGRIFGKGKEKEAKYLNSPETLLFNKSNTLFGIDKAKISIRKRNYSIIVEGQFDLILSHQAGFTNTVAVSGTALSGRISDQFISSSEKGSNQFSKESKINNLGLVRRLSQNIIFAFDGDQAGIRAASRSAMIALSLDMQVKIANIPKEQDPADIILEDLNKWKEIIKNSVDIINFHLNMICQNTDDIRLRGKKIREVIFPFLLVIKSSIEKSAYINLIYKKTGITEDAINKDFENYEKAENLNESRTTQKINEKMKSRKDYLEESLMEIVFWQKEINSLKANQNKTKLDEINELYDNFREKIGKEEFIKMREKYNPDSSVLAFKAEIQYGDKTDEIIYNFREIALNLEEEILKEKLPYLHNEINQKENNNDEEKKNSLLKNYQEIVERIEEIKNYRAQ